MMSVLVVFVCLGFIIRAEGRQRKEGSRSGIGACVCSISISGGKTLLLISCLGFSCLVFFVFFFFVLELHCEIS